MSSDHSVTAWIAGLKSGDELAAQAVWGRYFEQLCGVARAKLGAVPRRVQDDEDLALSAIHALCAGAREGRFRQLDNRDDLWQVLVMITGRKASNVRRKQSDRREAGESAVVGPSDDTAVGLAEVLAGRPSAAFADSLCASCEELLARLEPKLRDVALLKLAGHTNEEVAALRDRSVKTVERYLQMIRLAWGAG